MQENLLTHCLDSLASLTALKNLQIFRIKKHPFAPPFSEQRSLMKDMRKLWKIPFLKPWKWQESALFLSFVHFLLRSPIQF